MLDLAEFVVAIFVARRDNAIRHCAFRPEEDADFLLGSAWPALGELHHNIPDLSACSLEPMMSGNPSDKNILVNGTLDIDHVIQHGAESAFVVVAVERLGIGL